jgi:hypothetical protein
MKIAILLSFEAREDIKQQRRYYTQPGAGKPAARKQFNLSRAIKTRLRTEFRIHKQDRFHPENQQLLVDGFTISYNVFQSEAGTIFIQVDRVFGPGQDRT